MSQHHGLKGLAGQAVYCQRGHTRDRSDRFGRMFDHLAPAYVPADILEDIGRQGGPMDGGKKKNRTKTVPVGQVIFGRLLYGEYS